MKKKLYSLSEIVNRKWGTGRVFCFGAGKLFRGISEVFPNLHFEKVITFVADNDSQKKGTYVSFGEYKVEIIDVSMLTDIITDNDLIVITSVYEHAIEEQLNQIEKLNRVTYCGYDMAVRLQHDAERREIVIPERLFRYGDIKIPKIIHYCWFGGKPIPENYKEWMSSWSKFCPDYEIVEWNENNYDISKSLYMKQAYEQGKWAFVSDYARIDIIEQNGGIYLDTDVELVKNIDELLKNDLFCGFESEKYVAFGLGFGAIKHHPLLKEIREVYDSDSFIMKDGSMNLKTCPQYQTETLLKHGLVQNGQYQVLDGVTVLPVVCMCGMSPYTFRIEKDNPNVYAIHHYAASWNETYRQNVRERIVNEIRQSE